MTVKKQMCTNNKINATVIYRASREQPLCMSKKIKSICRLATFASA